MRPFVTLLVREWQEWRMVMAVVAAIYVLGLVVSAVALQKGSNAFLSGRGHIDMHYDRDLSNGDEFDEDPFLDEEDDSEWVSPKEMGFFSMVEIFRFSGRADLILFGWTHMLRGGVSFINLSFMVLALFYLADAVFNERADGSTYFYRSLPVGDGALLAAKLLVGTVGFMGLSFILGVGSVLFAQLTFPDGLAEYIAADGYAAGQVAILDLFSDWTVFHVLQLLWLLPFATYLLFVSTVTRSRPLLVAIAVPLLVGILWRYLMGNNAFLREITTNLMVLGDVLGNEWLGHRGPEIEPGATIELFGSFTSYIFSLRTVVSLMVAGGFFAGTFFTYRKNLAAS